MSKIKQGFVRGVWGIYDKDNKLGRPYSRRTKIDNDIELTSLNPYAPKCKVYVFGEDNFKFLTDKGWDTVLIDKRPIVWDMVKEQYRHKIEIWRAGLQEFNEIVFLDWDCVPTREIPTYFWEKLSVGMPIKATIYMYKLKRVIFRIGNERKVSASTFVYINGLEHCENIIKTWEEIGRPWQEEIALSKYIDILNGGNWLGIDDYLKKFEPEFHTLYNWYPSDYVKNVMYKENIFYHLNCHVVAGLLGNGNKDEVKHRIDDIDNRFKSARMALYNNRLKEEAKELEKNKEVK